MEVGGNYASLLPVASELYWKIAPLVLANGPNNVLRAFADNIIPQAMDDLKEKCWVPDSADSNLDVAFTPAQVRHDVDGREQERIVVGETIFPHFQSGCLRLKAPYDRLAFSNSPQLPDKITGMVVENPPGNLLHLITEDFQLEGSVAKSLA